MKLLSWTKLLWSGVGALVVAACAAPPLENAPIEHTTSNGDSIYLAADDGEMFQVAFATATPPDAYWCAAGEFARDVAGLPLDMPIKRQSGLLAADTALMKNAGGEDRRLKLPDNRVIFTRSDDLHVLDLRPEGSTLKGENVGYFNGSVTRATIERAIARCDR